MNKTLIGLSLFCYSSMVIVALVIWIKPCFRAVTLGQISKFYPTMIWVAMLLVISCVMPMGLSPIHNGDQENFRNQYEMITESFLNGQLHFQYKADERLLAMENPYDTMERINQNISFHWDHALYNGRYYMYFGVVPVLLLFLPFRLITGQALTGYHGTQIFVAVYIIGLFMVLWLLGKKFFREMTLSMYLLLCAAIAYLSIWFAVAAPALYSMAIVAGLACAIWSMYFFMKAVWICETENKAIIYAAIGSLLGALEFGCRPTVGLSNFIVCPLVAAFLQKNKISVKLLSKMLLAALPYVFVAIGLMIYNEMRFDNPFEFGQSYQLTIIDQTGYSDMVSRFDLKVIIRNLYFYLFNNMLSLTNFDPLPEIGPFVTFPLLPVAFVLLLFGNVRKHLYRNRLLILTLFLLFSVGIIIVFDVLWAPIPLPRYRMDFSWLLGIVAFILIGVGMQQIKHQNVLHVIIGSSCILVLLVCFFLFLYPTVDGNFAYYYGFDILSRLIL